jgi:cytochrome P450
MRANYPPGPEGHFLLGNLLQIRRGFLRLMMSSAHTYGDIVHFRVGLTHLYLVNHPDYIHKVLVEQAQMFQKTRLLRHVAGKFIGNGLIVSNGDFHKQQRRLMQPAFHFKRIEMYCQTTIEYTLHMLDTWQDGQQYDIEQAMVKLTAGIIGKTLLGANVTNDANRVSTAMTTLQKFAIKQFDMPIPIPDWLPISQNLEKQHAVRELDEILMRIINEHREAREDRGDLLSMLLLAVDDNNGTQMSNTQIRDEALTLFLAGHETTSNALSWTWYLLSQHAEAEAKLIEEVDRVLEGRMPTFEDLARLQYTGMVLKEAMRLYPPVWIMSREAVKDTTIDGYSIKKGSTVFICPLMIQKDPRFFDKPGEFVPERFAEGYEKRIPQYAYFPFGGGPRICIGQSLAQMVAKIVLVTIVQRYRLSLASDQIVVSARLATLRPKYGLRMNIGERKSTAVKSTIDNC